MKSQSLFPAIALGVVHTVAVAQQAAPPDSWAIEEIVVRGTRSSLAAPAAVTATRTTTALERVPQSVQVLTRTLIEEQDLQNVSAALRNVSGVSPSSNAEVLLQAPLVRGFAAGYFVDGMPAYSVPAGMSDPASLVNVDRIEVAKGPTSTLYGGGTGAPLAGLVNLVSKSPLPQAGAAIGLRGGSFGTRGAEVDANLPLVGEALLLRVTGAYEEADSHIDELDSTRYSVYPTLAWHATPDTTLTLRGQYSDNEQLEYAGLPFGLVDAAGVDPETFAGAEDAPPTSIENRMLSLQLEHDFSETLRATLTMRHFENDAEEFGSFPFPDVPVAGSTYFFASGYLPSEVEENYLGANLVAELGCGTIRHQLLGGIELDDTDYDAALGFGFLGFVDYADPATNPSFGATPVPSDVQSDGMRTLALYLQDQIAIGERLDITLGLRGTELQVESLYTSGGIPFADTDETDRSLVPRLGASWRFADGLHAFAGYAEGFQGVVATFGLTDPEPETSRSYELGLKLAEPVQGLTGTVALYEITRENVRTPDPLNPFASVQTGEQRSRGLETDLVWEPAPSLSVLFSYTYSDAEVTEDNSLPEGDRLARVPEHSGRLAARYRFARPALQGLEIGGGLTAVSERELTLPNAYAVDGSLLLDAQISWDFGGYSVALSALNLTDEDEFEPYQYLGRSVVIPTQPRSAFLSVRAEFGGM
jgi:iron complex outermembrane receptor protein